MADSSPEEGVVVANRQHYASVSTEELATMYDDLIQQPHDSNSAPENINDAEDEARVNAEEGTTANVQNVNAEDECSIIENDKHVNNAEKAADSGEHDIYIIPPDTRRYDSTDLSSRGPPTFGDSDRFMGRSYDDEWSHPQPFANLSNNNMVVRNIRQDARDATLSFGYDETQHFAAPYPEVIEAVNYYMPSPQKHRRDTPLYGDSERRATYTMGNMGGDTTTSTHSRYSNDEDDPAVCERYMDDGSNSPVSPGTGVRSTRSRTRNVHRRAVRNTSPASECAQSSDSDSNDGTSASFQRTGLFEVPLNVCSMSRIIDPFKGFSKVHTARAVKLLHFTKKGDRTLCSLVKSAAKIIQTQVKDLQVVTIGVCGDARTGKSYLASMLVNKPTKSFRCSEAYSAKEAMNQMHQPPEGAVWAYVGVYQEKYAYIYLDIDGFENHQAQRIDMIKFVLLLSNCVICNVANPPRTGIYDMVRAMIDVVKHDRMSFEEDIGSIEMQETIEEFRKKTSFLLNEQNILSKSFDSKEHETIDANEEVRSDAGEANLWKAPIVHFVFRDSEGHVKCMDERLYTPETLVEQGIFEHYANIFNCARRDRGMDFKNDMLDAFEIFTNRKYTSLPCPVVAPKSLSMPDHSAALNAKHALKRIFATLLAPANADIMSADVAVGSKTRLIGANAPTGQPNISSIPNHLLNPHFCERLDEVKACVYQDTLSHVQSCMQLNGGMFVNYLKQLIAHFNMHGMIKLRDAKAIVRDVRVKENVNISRDVIVQFFKGLKHHVVMQLPIEPRVLLSRCMRLKQKSLHEFQTRVLGDKALYREQYEYLEKSLDGLIEKLEAKNDKIANDAAVAMFDRCAKSLDEKLTSEQYTYDELLVDIAKMRKLFLEKFKGHSEVTEKVFPQLTRQLYRRYEEHHPKTPTPNMALISKRQII
ncbi:guanylate binding protein [Babesia ovata]|uniref:Guanylate binding protein n=1 Tax=Babesia ovata TaxID=189622 RepID=A0A2H6KI34_9APIC|nr:guanylate binding protein [Babesia ovata]GBE62656.1 guanylate binding protein [Babesia ovata]